MMTMAIDGVAGRPNRIVATDAAAVQPAVSAQTAAPVPGNVQRGQRLQGQQQQLETQLAEQQRQLEEAARLAEEALQRAEQAQAEADRIQSQEAKDEAARQRDQSEVADRGQIQKQFAVDAIEADIALKEEQAADAFADRAPSDKTLKAQDAADVAHDNTKMAGKYAEAAQADAAANQAERDARPAANGSSQDWRQPGFAAATQAGQRAVELRAVADRAQLDFNNSQLEASSHDAQRSAKAASRKAGDLNAQLKAAEDKGDTNSVAALKIALPAAIDAENSAKATAQARKAAFEEGSAQLRQDEAGAVWRNQFDSQVRLLPQQQIDRNGSSTKTPAGYDATFYMTPTDGKVRDENEGKYVFKYTVLGQQEHTATAQRIDGRWYIVDGDTKTEMHSTTASMWTAYNDKTTAQQDKRAAEGQGAKVNEDAQLGAGAWLERADTIGSELESAKEDAVAKNTALNDYLVQHPGQTILGMPGADRELDCLLTDLAVSVEKRNLAQANANGLEAVRAWADAKRKLYDLEQVQGGGASDPRALKEARDAADAAGVYAKKMTGAANTRTDTQATESQREAEANASLPQARAELVAADKKLAELSGAVALQGAPATAEQQAAINGTRRARDLAQMNVTRYEATLKSRAATHALTLDSLAQTPPQAPQQRNPLGLTPAPARKPGVGFIVGTEADLLLRKPDQPLAPVAIKARDAANSETAAWGEYAQYKDDIVKMDAAPDEKSSADDAVVQAIAARSAAQDNQANDPQAYENAVTVHELALQHQSAVAVKMQWVDADKARQQAEANDRLTGRAPGNPSDTTKTARQTFKDLRSKSDDQLANWQLEQNKHNLQVARRTLAGAQHTVKQWEQTHAGENPLQSAEFVAALIDAGQTVDDLEDQQKQSAVGSAGLKEKAFIEANLDPARRDDKAALHELFQKQPELMSQATLNAEARNSAGGRKSEMSNSVHLGNTIGLALGWQPGNGFGQGDPMVGESTLSSRDVFTDLTPQSRAQREAIVKQIERHGGSTPTITVIPILYSSKETGTGKTALFKVESADDKVCFVDDQGLLCKGDTIEEARSDFQANSSLPTDDAVMVMPELKSEQELLAEPDSGLFKYTDDGHVKLWHGEARTEGWWEHTRRVNPWIDPVIGVAGFAAGVVMTVGSGGLLVAAGVAMVATTVYGIKESAADLKNMLDHGLLNSAGDLVTDQRARMSGVSLLGAALGLGSFGAGARAASALTRSAGSAARWGVTAQLTGRGAFGAGAAGFVDTGVHAAKNWREMSTTDRTTTLFNLALNSMDMTAPWWQARMKKDTIRIAAPTTRVPGLDGHPPGNWAEIDLNAPGRTAIGGPHPVGNVFPVPEAPLAGAPGSASTSSPRGSAPSVLAPSVVAFSLANGSMIAGVLPRDPLVRVLPSVAGNGSVVFGPNVGFGRRPVFAPESRPQPTEPTSTAQDKIQTEKTRGAHGAVGTPPPQGSDPSTRGLGADGRPLAPSSFAPDRTWEEVASNAQDDTPVYPPASASGAPVPGQAKVSAPKPDTEPHFSIISTEQGPVIRVDHILNISAALDELGVQHWEPGRPLHIEMDTPFATHAARISKELIRAGFDIGLTYQSSSSSIFSFKVGAVRRSAPQYESSPEVLDALDSRYKSIPRDSRHYVRDPAKPIWDEIADAFLRNGQDAAEEFAVFFARGEFDGQGLMDLSRRMHELAVYGKDGQRPYRWDVDRAGEFDQRSGMRNAYFQHVDGVNAHDHANQVAAEHGLGGLTGPVLRGFINVPGVSSQHFPENQMKGNGSLQAHFYPNSEAFPEYFAQGARELAGLKQQIDSGRAAPKEIVDAIADHYHTMINVQAHPKVNNTLRMIEVNYLLRYAGVNEGISHGNLDVLAMRFRREGFREIFAAHIESAQGPSAAVHDNHQSNGADLIAGYHPASVLPSEAGASGDFDQRGWVVPADRLSKRSVHNTLQIVHEAGGRLDGAVYVVYPQGIDVETGTVADALNDGLQAVVQGTPSEERASLYAHARSNSRIVRPECYRTLDEALAATQAPIPAARDDSHGGTRGDGIALVAEDRIDAQGNVPQSAVIASLIPKGIGATAEFERVVMNTTFEGTIRVAWPDGYVPGDAPIGWRDGVEIDYLNAAPGRTALGVNLFRRRPPDLDLISDRSRVRRPDGSPVYAEDPVPEGLYYVDGHGVAGGRWAEGSDGKAINGWELAELILAAENYHGQDIYLPFCEGAEGVVQLAHELSAALPSVNVYANDGTTVSSGSYKRQETPGDTKYAWTSLERSKTSPKLEPRFRRYQPGLPIAQITEMNGSVVFGPNVGLGRRPVFAPESHPQPTEPTSTAQDEIQTEETKGARGTVGTPPPQGSDPSTRGLGADGRPLAPSSFAPSRTWEEVASNAQDLVDRHREANDPGSSVPALQSSANDAALFAYLTRDRATDASTLWTVTPELPDSSAGVRTKRSNTFASFDAARQAALSRGGAWVSRVEPDAARPAPVRRGRADADELMISAFYDVHGAMPIAIPNLLSAAWQRPVAAANQAASAAPAALSTPTAALLPQSWPTNSVQEALNRAIVVAENEINAVVLAESPKSEGAIDAAATQAVDVHKVAVDGYLGTAVPSGRQAIDAGATAAVQGHGASIGISAQRAVHQIQDGFQSRSRTLADETQSRLDEVAERAVRAAQEQFINDVTMLSGAAKTSLRAAAGSGKGAQARLTGALAQSRTALETAIAIKRRASVDAVRHAVDTDGAAVYSDFENALATTGDAAVADAQARAARLAKLPGLDEGRRVESPTSVGGATRWVDVARQAPRLVAEHFAALRNGKTSPMNPDEQELAQMNHLQAPQRNDPKHPDLDTKFYVTDQYPARRLYKRAMRTAPGPVGFMARTMGIYTGKGLRGRKLPSYDTFHEAQQASKATGGGWVYRVEPKAGLRAPTTRRWVMPREIMGGAYVNFEGKVAPLPIVNTHADAWAALLPDGKLGVAVDPSHGDWPNGLTPPAGFKRNDATKLLEPVTLAKTEPASKTRTAIRTAVATGTVLGVAGAVYEGVPRLAELAGVHVTPTDWLIGGVTAFSYRAWIASIKGGWKNGMLNRIRELRDPGLSQELRNKYIDTLERQLGQGPHPWRGQVLRGRMRGVPKSDREVISALADVLRKGDPHLQALVLDQFEGYAGSLLARKSGIGKFQDFLRTLSFGATFSRNAMTLFDPHAPATDIYQILSRHVVGNEGSLAGFIATASRYNSSEAPGVNRFTKALPAFSSLGDALSVVALFGHDYLQIKSFHAAGQEVYAALQMGTVPVEVWLGKMLVDDFVDDIRGVWKNPDTPYESRLMNTLFTPSAAPTRKIPPLIMLGPAALAYATIALAPLFIDDPKNVPDPSPTPTPTTAPPTTPSATPTSSPSPSSSPTASATSSPLPSTSPPPRTGKPPIDEPPPNKTEPPAPPPADVYWTVDGRVKSLSSFTRIAEAVAERDHTNFNQALDQLFNLNPKYKRSQMDGYVSPTRLDDPDALNNGTEINTGVPARARA
jgi:hypothetical protein